MTYVHNMYTIYIYILYDVFLFHSPALRFRLSAQSCLAAWSSGTGFAGIAGPDGMVG